MRSSARTDLFAGCRRPTVRRSRHRFDFLRRRAGVAAVALLGALSARGADLPTGRILEPVACAADAAQTYALYVPSSYDPARTWPVIFCFDPGARGRTPVERFEAAAEKFGYLVAGSNNSRNGPWPANAAAIKAMINDVDTHLKIDSHRIYVAGLSGVARVACQVALGGLARGVIACSAAFPGSETPAKVPFLFFGTTGLTDFNYLELRRTDRELDSRHAAHRVVVFPGGHEWLSSDLAIEAVAWLELQEMTSGRLARNGPWLQEQFKTRLAAVPTQPTGERYLGLKSVAGDFKGVADTAPVEAEVTALGASREIKDWTKAERARENREDALMDELMSAVQEGAPNSARKRIETLRAQSQAPDDSPDRQLAFRVLQGAYMNSQETARELMRTEDYATAEQFLVMATMIRPERGQLQFELASARAHLGNKKGALAALQQAVAGGFKDIARVEGERAFAPLRADPAYRAAIAAMK